MIAMIHDLYALYLVVLVLLAIFASVTLGPAAGLRFAGIQAIAMPLMFAGWIILAPLCAARCFKQYGGVNGLWHFSRAFWVWDNDEDGVMPKSYNPTASAWRVYVWTAWRNSVNNLRYLFLWKGGPIYRWQNSAGTWYYQHGFRQDSGWPVWSAGRV